ncbi:sensor domain-containing diguanylate cyclase [Azospirillum picis]|uniref:Diguanylate cyclase (GGDEF)-like protein/PAS domain S-box-containing protein n=1 Tax=Azospirillum picis TaxID=488438 RepID=A0ABU0MGL5_9PROT|nr:diguanylate cyclase [Azospirillum picis]MBP2298381.1 diguanylate cyclase (GGDEF)-like protein/PAS domain S-box-containing protein [Azospirillum picis]MDQ0532570.1 diguanylate cyclase (GGDEF)-like protein/PAS domain S-box-containing protein [Azospirillum picis]
MRYSAWSAFDFLPIGVCLATGAGTIRYGNPALEDLLGNHAAGLAGRTLRDLGLEGNVDARTEDRRAASLRAARTADGARRWVAVAESAWTGGLADDEVLRLLTVTDAGGVRAEAPPFVNGPAWRSGEASVVAAMMAATPVPLFVKDAVGRYIAVNDAFERFTGIDRDEMMTRDSFAVAGPGDAEQHCGQDQMVMDRAVTGWQAGGGTEGVHYEAAVRTAEGAPRMVCLTKAAFLDAAGNPAGIVGAIHELADIRPQEERLEAILEQSPIGVSVSRREDGRIIFVNSRFSDLIGLPRERLVGSCARDYYLDSHQRQRVVERLRDGGGVTNMEVQFKRADGSPFWALFTVNQAVIQGVPVNLAWIYDYTERRGMEEALRDMASRDPLTGIFNRRSFMDMARAQLARAHRFHEPLSVFVLDVDHFKRINDTFGHASGDDALRMVAAGCQAILREYDILGRLGGEEFVVVLPGATADESRVVAERVRRHLARMQIETADGSFRLTASIGIAGLEGATDTLERAIHRADLALYRAKHMGRNRVAVYEPGL